MSVRCVCLNDLICRKQLAVDLCCGYSRVLFISSVRRHFAWWTVPPVLVRTFAANSANGTLVGFGPTVPGLVISVLSGVRQMAPEGT